MNPTDLLVSFSRALYSQWFYHKPSRCLFDAGEGVATTLGKKVFGIRYVFLSHRQDPWITALLEYVEKKQRGLLRYPLYVQPLEPGDEVEIEGTGRPTRVTAIEAQHARARLCLGFEVEEERKVEDAMTGEHVRRFHPTLFYSGDGAPQDYQPVGRVDIAIHESTFLERDAGEAAKRVEHRHATVEQAVDWAASLDVKSLILCHISERYHTAEIAEVALASKERSGFRGELYIAREGAIMEVGNETVEA
jgi:ribonuclease Z